MKSHNQLTSISKEMEDARNVFDSLTADGQAGQEAEQGMGNYYLTDPVERRNFEFFMKCVAERAPRLGNRILVAACGDGLETELLARQGYDVTAFDFSHNMVRATRNRLGSLGLNANLYVDDVTNLDLSRYYPGYAGVMFAQAAAFLPVAGKKDALLSKAIADLASRTPEGAFYWSTTYYADPKHQRPWVLDGKHIGTTTYYARPIGSVAAMIRKSGLEIVRTEQFDAGNTPPDDYKNDYIIAARR